MDHIYLGTNWLSGQFWGLNETSENIVSTVKQWYFCKRPATYCHTYVIPFPNKKLSSYPFICWPKNRDKVAILNRKNIFYHHSNPIHPEKKVKVNEENFIELFKIFFSNEKNIIFSGSTPPSSWTKSNMKADKDENKQILKSDSELFILLYDFFSFPFLSLLYGMRQRGSKAVWQTVILPGISPLLWRFISLFSFFFCDIYTIFLSFKIVGNP